MKIGKTPPTDEQQWVRHEVSYVIVLLKSNETRPAIPLAVPDVVIRDGNVSVGKPTHNVPTVAELTFTSRGETDSLIAQDAGPGSTVGLAKANAR